MSATGTTTQKPRPVRHPLIVTLAWLAVSIPLLWGVVETLQKALALFQTQ